MKVPETTEGIGEYFAFRARKSQKTLALGDEGILISEKTAKTLGVSAGDTLTVGEGSSAREVRVSAVYENYIGHYIFLSSGYYKSVFGEEPVFTQLLLRYEDVSDAHEDAIGKFVLSETGAQGITFLSATIKWADDTLASLNNIVIIVLVAAALLAFVVLYNLNSINIAERKRELATLKVLGFYDTEVASYIYKENIFLTVIGIAFGLGLGVLLHSYVIRSIEVDGLRPLLSERARTISADKYQTFASF